MTDREEQAWLDGEKAAWRRMLSECIRALGDDTPPEARSALREHDTRVALRSLCDELGCGGWPDDLHLADVVNKYLGRWCRERNQEEQT